MEVDYLPQCSLSSLDLDDLREKEGEFMWRGSNLEVVLCLLQPRVRVS